MSETNSYKIATDSIPVRTLSLTDAQLQQVKIALSAHADQLYENLMFRPSMANQEKLDAARQALQIVQEA